jgi:general secretion pathway protein C
MVPLLTKVRAVEERRKGGMAILFHKTRWPVSPLAVLEYLLLALLAIQTVRLLWTFVTPAGALGLLVAEPPHPKADFTILSRFDPFFRGLDGGPASAASSGSYSLFGVRAGADGRGSAILAGPDGQQRSYGVGEAIAPGLLLTWVGRDYVLLSHAGKPIRIAFATRPDAVSLPISTSSVPVQGGSITPKTFLSENSFMPRMQGGQVLGYAISPRRSSRALQQAGLEPGDIIRTINGAALSRNRFEEIESEFAGTSQVEFTIERGGKTLTKTLLVAK